MTTTFDIFIEDLGQRDLFEVEAEVEIEHVDDSDMNLEYGYGRKEIVISERVTQLVIREINRDSGDVLDGNVTDPLIVRLAEDRAIERAREEFVDM